MQYKAILKIIGVLLTIFSLTMLPPALVAWAYDERTMWLFLEIFAATLLSGLVRWLPLRHYN